MILLEIIYKIMKEFCELLQSLPVRERGLKFLESKQKLKEERSLPVRERGLKLSCAEELKKAGYVAPCAGAWIEIYYLQHNRTSKTSLPVRERGLKSLNVRM